MRKTLRRLAEKLGLVKAMESIGLHTPTFTHEWCNKDEAEQTVECKVFKDGTFSHTVRVKYFTKGQIDEIRGLQARNKDEQ